MNKEKQAHWRYELDQELEDTSFLNSQIKWSQASSKRNAKGTQLLSRVQFYNQKDEQFLIKLSNLSDIEKPNAFETETFRREFKGLKIKLRVYVLEMILEQNLGSEMMLKFLVDEKTVKEVRLSNKKMSSQAKQVNIQINEMFESVLQTGDFETLTLALYKVNSSFDSLELFCFNTLGLVRRLCSSHWRNSQDKPIETRILTDQNTQNPKGTVKLWLEMFEEKEETSYPVYDINPYKNPEECEVRVVLFNLFEKNNKPILLKHNYQEFQVVAELELFPFEVEKNFSGTEQRTEVLYVG